MPNWMAPISLNEWLPCFCRCTQDAGSEQHHPQQYHPQLGAPRSGRRQPHHGLHGGTEGRRVWEVDPCQERQSPGVELCDEFLDWEPRVRVQNHRREQGRTRQTQSPCGGCHSQVKQAEKKVQSRLRRKRMNKKCFILAVLSVSCLSSWKKKEKKWPNNVTFVFLVDPFVFFSHTETSTFVNFEWVTNFNGPPAFWNSG